MHWFFRQYKNAQLGANLCARSAPFFFALMKKVYRTPIGRNLLLSLSPFERAAVCIKHFEGLHGKDCYPYVGYGHKLQKREHFTAAMTERQADSLLRADLMKRLMMFTDYGKDALLLAVLSYNVGTGRLLGYGKHPKSRLLRKIESGDRNFCREFVSFCRYKGKVLRGLVKRRKVEFDLFYIP